MMIILHPRAAPPDRLRVWLGAVGCRLPQILSWKLDGQPTKPCTLAPLASVRKNKWVEQAERRAFTGVYEFTGLNPASCHKVVVCLDGHSAELSAHTLPAEVPNDQNESFRVLLVSCFDRGMDRTGLAGGVVADLPNHMRPHMTLLLGDQVYLDLPTLKDFKDDTKWLAREFEKKYIFNWFEYPAMEDPSRGYAQVLRAAPSVSIPDDHEYWNNYPHASPIVGNTWRKKGRQRWCVAARRLYDAFQGAHPIGLGDSWHMDDVEPLSFFFADSRTDRDPDRRFALKETDHCRLERWVDWLQQHPDRVGIFVTGQSLLEPGSNVGGLTDYELQDHCDYQRLSKTLLRVPGNLLLLTGDLHWGRITRYRRSLENVQSQVVEVVSSPASLVESVVLDQFRIVKNFIAGLFGNRHPWPRHKDPDKPPACWLSGSNGAMHLKKWHGQRGNHVTMLAFQRIGGRIRVRATCISLHKKPQYRESECTSFDLLTYPNVGDHL